MPPIRAIETDRSFRQERNTWGMWPFLRGLKGLGAAVTLALAAGSASAMPADLPELGDSSRSVLSLQAEQEIGVQSMRQLRATGGYLDDPEVNAYLDGLGRRLLAGDTSIDGKFEFFAVPSSEINAFALPGGYIGVNTGLILLTENESQLASVLAHEISHVTQHHVARQLASQSAGQATTIAALVAAVLASRAGGDVSGGILQATAAMQLQNQIDATRRNEQEADRIGFKLLVAAGFDPQAMPDFFARLQNATRTMETNAPVYLRSHPLTPDRIAEAENRAQNLPYRQVADSREYRFVRALLRSYDGTPESAVARLGTELKTGDSQNRDATRYGYAAALLRAKDFKRAGQEIDTLDRTGVAHPMIEALAGQILQQSGQYKAALKRYEAALKRYPTYRQLIYDYPRTLILDKQPAAAATFAEHALMTMHGDADLHQIAAEANAAIGKQARSHYHQGEFYAARGDLEGAIGQLELAVRDKHGDFRDLSIAEARLRELRAQRPKPEAGERGRLAGNGLAPDVFEGRPAP